MTKQRKQTDFANILEEEQIIDIEFFRQEHFDRIHASRNGQNAIECVVVERDFT